MLRNPYFQLICAIFRVINALRNRNDGFDCYALTSQSKVSTHVQYVGGYVRTGNRKYDPYTCIGPPQYTQSTLSNRACARDVTGDVTVFCLGMTRVRVSEIVLCLRDTTFLPRNHHKIYRSML